MMRSTLLLLAATAHTTLGRVVASWLLPTAPIARKFFWSVDTTDMLRAIAGMIKMAVGSRQQQ
jgi:hypothetical protein